MPSHWVACAGVVVDEHGNVLITQRADNGRWEAPGGALELNEGLAECCRREVFEETGVEIVPHAVTGVYKNMPRGIVAVVFRCSQIGGEPVVTAETQAVKWASVEEATSLMSPAFSCRITDAFGSGVLTRSHDGENLL